METSVQFKRDIQLLSWYSQVENETAYLLMTGDKTEYLTLTEMTLSSRRSRYRQGLVLARAEPDGEITVFKAAVPFEEVVHGA